MIKAMIILMAFVGAIAYALLIASSHTEDRETYEAYQRWKERRRNERHD